MSIEDLQHISSAPRLCTKHLNLPALLFMAADISHEQFTPQILRFRRASRAETRVKFYGRREDVGLCFVMEPMRM